MHHSDLPKNTQQGTILRGVGGFYYVFDGERIHECKARGRFRKDGITPMVGDLVEFLPEQDSYGYLEEILPRHSLMVRPPLANIDLMIVVIAATSPPPDLLLVDKLLVAAHTMGVEASLCINKIDLATSTEIAGEYQAAGYGVDCLSIVSGEGIPALLTRLQGRISAFAGQSGVGKSSLINALQLGYDLKVGEVSKMERGRHTTRHCELLVLPNGGGFLADTPGFSLLDTNDLDPLWLKDHYVEFLPWEGQCRFDGCSHLKEPGCAVRMAAERGEISLKRVDRYAELFHQTKERWDRRYD